MSANRLNLEVAPALRGRRIIFVFGSLELGGAERQALILARHLSEREGAHVAVWGFNRVGPVAAMCEQHGLAWRVVSYHFTGRPLTRLADLTKLAWLLRRARPDILLPYTLVPNVACGLVWRRTGARLCVWNQRDEGIARLSPGIEGRAVRRTPRFISNSQRGARFLVDELGASPAIVAVINNGVECTAPEMDRAAWREHLKLDDDCFAACMVGNLHGHKDHRTLLRAWHIVRTTLEADGRGAVLILAGKFDDSYESLIALSSELGFGYSVRFIGSVSDVPGLLSAVDLSVFSSRSEGCPNAVLESMAAGLAVAGTDIDGVREAVGAAGAPFLAPPGDARALAEIILKLATDPTLRSELRTENRNRIRDHYDPLRMCGETVSLLANSLHSETR